MLIIMMLAIQSIAGAARPGSWGYIIHTSRLTDTYLQTTIPHYSVISLSGYKLGPDGGLIIESNSLMKQVIGLCKKHDVNLYPLIIFNSSKGGSRLLNSKLSRIKAVQSIIALVREYKFKGIHLDFEYLPPQDSKKLGEFLAELKASRFRGSVTMAIFPHIDFPEKWSGFHDLAVIGKHADEIVLMCYDLHGRHTKPGPITDIVWAEKNIQAALKHVKAGKIWLGVPAYGYQWCNAATVAISAKQAVALSLAYHTERDHSLNIRVSYQKSGQKCVVYASDAITRAGLAQLAIKYDLAGTAIWRLGFED